MDVLTLENITMLVGFILAGLFLVVCGCVLHANRTHVAYILAPMVDLLRRAAYVERGQDELPTNEDDDLRFPAFPENGNGAVPAQPVAGKLDGNSGLHFQSLEAANTYAETLLIERLAELVLAEKLDKSVAIKVGMRAATGRAYQAAKEKLETAMVKQRYPTLTASRTKAISSIAKG